MQNKKDTKYKGETSISAYERNFNNIETVAAKKN